MGQPVCLLEDLVMDRTCPVKGLSVVSDHFRFARHPPTTKACVPEHQQVYEDEDALEAGSVLRRPRRKRHFGYAVGVVEGSNQPLPCLLLQDMGLKTFPGLAWSAVCVPIPDH